MPLPIRIVIADDHLLFRQGLKALLKQEPEVTVVGETDRVRRAAGARSRGRRATNCCSICRWSATRWPTSSRWPSEVRVVVLTASEAAGRCRSPPFAWARARWSSSASRWKR